MLVSSSVGADLVLSRRADEPMSRPLQSPCPMGIRFLP